MNEEETADHPGIQNWIDNSTPEDRVRSVITTANSQMKVTELAERAFVERSEAAGLLVEMVEEGAVEEREDGYVVSSGWVEDQIVDELVRDYTRDELEDLRVELDEAIADEEDDLELRTFEYRRDLVDEAMDRVS